MFQQTLMVYFDNETRTSLWAKC